MYNASVAFLPPFANPYSVSLQFLMSDPIQHYGVLFVYHWLDLIWLVVAPVLVHPGQRLKVSGFVFVCLLMLRLQVELAETMGFAKGVTGWFTWAPMIRGYVVYGIFITLFLILSHFSPRSRGAIYLAASLTIFFMAFLVSTIVLII